MTSLSPLFHWSPSTRRSEIRAGGLRPFCLPSVSSGDVAFPYVCLSPTPSRAWSLSGDMEWVSEIEEWDLWQVELPDGAEVHVRPVWGRVIEEVKVYSAIGAEHVWFVGSRDVPFAEPIAS